MKKNILIVLLAIPFVLSSNNIAHAGPCESQNSTHEMNQCADLLYEEADDELNEVWQALPNRTRNKLRQSQRDWIKYRDRICKEKADEIAGEGSMRYIILIGCKTDETQQRTKYLEEFLF